MSDNDAGRTLRRAEADTEGARFKEDTGAAGKLFWRSGGFLTEDTLGIDAVDMSAGVLLRANDDGGADGLRMFVCPAPLVFVPFVIGGVDNSALALPLAATVVVTSQAAPTRDEFEKSLGLIPPDDVPAAADREVVRETREGASDGGLAGMIWGQTQSNRGIET